VGTNYQLVEKKKLAKKWGSHGRPGHCGSIALGMVKITMALLHWYQRAFFSIFMLA